MQIEEQIITPKIQFVTISYTNAKFNFQSTFLPVIFGVFLGLSLFFWISNIILFP